MVHPRVSQIELKACVEKRGEKLHLDYGGMEELCGILQHAELPAQRWRLFQILVRKKKHMRNLRKCCRAPARCSAHEVAAAGTLEFRGAACYVHVRIRSRSLPGLPVLVDLKN